MSVETHPRLSWKRTAVFNNLGNLADLMRNAGKLQESVQKATESLGQVQVEASSGGGVVTAKANGRLELLSVRIDPKLLADGDVELLEDLVTAAANQALVKAREAAAKSLSSMAGGLNIPGFPGLFGPGGGGA
jgi:DNA-binding YbaB/EbfC family protein